jgi:hypothetical protein
MSASKDTQNPEPHSEPNILYGGIDTTSFEAGVRDLDPPSSGQLSVVSILALMQTSFALVVSATTSLSDWK